MTLLSVRDLHVGFGKDPVAGEVVRGVSFDLNAGETVALVGESGSGKSVTAMAINRLADFDGGRITRGAIEFQTRSGETLDIAAAHEDQLAQIRGGEIGMIFQEPMTSLNPVLTIGNQIEEAFRLHRGLTGKAAANAAKDALDRVRIPDAARRLRYTPNQLSGGMLQRVMIAMALAANPRLLICDEPTTALDVTVQAQIMALLADLKRETNTALIFITHDIGLVAGIADKALVMQNGAVVEQGPLDAVLDRPQADYTKYLLNAVPHFEAGAAARSDGFDAAAKPALKVEDLSVRFPIRGGFLRRPIGAVHAVEGVDLELKPGETLAIVGESGSGKSTTARAIMGLVKPSTGRFEGFGRPSRGVFEGLGKYAAQMVFQNPYASLNPRLTIEQVLAEPVIAAGRPVDAAMRERMAMLLKRVGLPEDSLKRYPHQFSGGQRQRLCIARVLMIMPRIVVLDEAVSALDVSVQAKVLDLLVDLQKEFQLAYLFISHDMAVVERIAHRVAVMYGGRIVEIGKAAAVLSDPRHSYTKKLISAVPAIDRRRREFTLDQREVPSLVRPLGYEPAKADWKSYGDDHLARTET